MDEGEGDESAVCTLSGEENDETKRHERRQKQQQRSQHRHPPLSDACEEWAQCLGTRRVLDVLECGKEVEKVVDGKRITSRLVHLIQLAFERVIASKPDKQ